MTDTTPAPTLTISQALSDLLLWLLEDDVEVAKEVINKPWKWEDLAAIHAVAPDLDVDDAFDVLEAQQRDG